MRYEVQVKRNGHFLLVAVDCAARADAKRRGWQAEVRAPFGPVRENAAKVLHWASQQVGSDCGPLVERHGRDTFHVCDCGTCH